MARALYVAPSSPETAAQLASLRARVRELEAEVARLRSSQSDLDVELALVTAASRAGV